VHGPHVHSARYHVALTNVRTVLLDIEGTTTPIDFVHTTLFAYARARVQEFLERHEADADVQADIALLRAEHAVEAPAPNPPMASVSAYVHWLMDRDRKSTGLKSLQGKIWEEGYRSGTLRGEVYPDVPPALARWREQGKDIVIFSSGSVPAQRNLFASTAAGDLTRFIRAYFDTTTGPKTAAQSYARIAASLDRSPAKVLFVSDVGAELDAARAAGMQTALCVRAPGSPPATGGHPVVHRFDELSSA
jgi:enolase-phosphatase E1